MRRNPLIALLLMLSLSACSSTLPTTTARPDAGSQAPVVTSTPSLTPVASEGPITTSMATLQIGGERYATLGDPAAPLTLVEFSDFG